MAVCGLIDNQNPAMVASDSIFPVVFDDKRIGTAIVLIVIVFTHLWDQDWQIRTGQ
jgi:hypothetical protein